MNVLFVVHYTALYGANRSLLALLTGLQERGHGCSVIVPGSGPFTEALARNGVHYVIHDVPWSFGRKALPSWRSRIHAIGNWAKRERQTVMYVRRLIREHKIDLVHTNSVVVASGLFAALLERRPHVWHLREFADLDYDLVPLAGMRFIRWLIRRSRAVICVSWAVKDHFRLPDRSLVRVIYNGVASKAYMQRMEPRSGRTSDQGTFGIIGVVSPVKGQEVAIRALAIVKDRYPDVKLHVIGEGASIPQMQQLAVSLGVRENVVFHGYVSHVRALLKECDALLMCSKNEAMGRVTAEAMSEAIPVIGLASGGTRELIGNGTDGSLYSGSPEELAARMITLLEDRPLYARLSAGALEKARSWFSNEHYVDQVMDLYRSVIGK